MDAHVAGSVNVPNMATGTFELDYASRNFTGAAHIDTQAFAIFAGTTSI